MLGLSDLKISLLSTGSFLGGPSLALNFLSGFLDSRITFSRGSNATLVDATGKITYAPANLFTYSQDFTNVSAWANSNTPIRTPGQVDPDGGTTATKLELDVNDGIYQFVGSRTGNYVFSIWVRGDVAGTVRLSDASGGGFDISVNVATTWTRVNTGSRTVSGFFSPYIYRGAGDLATVYVAFAQLEQVTYQTTPSTYVATTASAYYGPRFDYDPVTLAPKGLLIEEARTNLVPYSSDFTNSSWVKSLSAMAGTFTAAPDGTNTGAKWREDSTNNQHAIYYATPTLTAAAYTETWYLKAAERTKVLVSLATAGLAYGASVIADLSAGTLSAVTNYGGHTGATATMSSASNGWYRVSITMTATAAVYYPALTMVTGTNTINYTGDGTSGIYIWGAQLELASFATSYIPTVASTVTRSADVATMTGTNFSSWYNQSEGTFVAQYAAFTSASGVKVALTAGLGADNDYSVRMGFSTNSAAAVSNIAGVNQATFSVPAVTTNYNEVAMAYKTNDFGFSANGSTTATDTSGSVYSPNSMSIGRSGSAYYLNGCVAAIAYYNTRLPNAQLQTLTAPSLATTLSLSFTNQAYTVGV